MHHAILCQIIQQFLLENGIVVAVVQCARATEEVDVLSAFLIDQHRPASLAEYHRKGPDVASHL